MASGINRAPLGLQSLLDTKSLGQNPDALSELVRPIVDLGPFWWAQRRWRAIEAEAATAAIGGILGTRITIPNQEVWLVPSLSARLVSGGAEGRVGFHVRALIDSPVGAAAQTALASWYNNNQFGALGETVQSVYTAPYPMLFPAGTVFEIFNGFTLAAAGTFRLSVCALNLAI